MLTFDEQAHQYFWNGAPVPNVTRIIAPLIDLSMIDPEVLERARLEGVRIHAMANLHFEDKLDVDALHQDERQAWLVPHYRALLKFIDETGFECWHTEKRLFHKSLLFAGTTDNIGQFTKIKDDLGAAVLDIKRTLYGGPATGLQLAAYRKAWNDSLDKQSAKGYARIRDSARFTLQLRADGTYRLTRFDDPADEVAFIACLQQYRWRERKYPKEKANGRA